MTQDEIIEVMVRAIGNANASNFGVVSFPNANWVAEATAVHAALAAKGLAIVPVEPTETMIGAGWRCIFDTEDRTDMVNDIYRAMIKINKIGITKV